MAGSTAKLRINDWLSVRRRLKHLNIFVFYMANAVMIYAHEIKQALIHCLPNQRGVDYFAMKNLSHSLVDLCKIFV